jgi:hypothetical protein
MHRVFPVIEELLNDCAEKTANPHTLSVFLTLVQSFYPI